MGRNMKSKTKKPSTPRPAKNLEGSRVLRSTMGTLRLVRSRLKGPCCCNCFAAAADGPNADADDPNDDDADADVDVDAVAVAAPAAGVSEAALAGAVAGDMYWMRPAKNKRPRAMFKNEHTMMEATSVLLKSSTAICVHSEMQ
mmetsp:Transcript_26225/g.38972  ORF Transcript_26225/g.38972 Transcript_26225/m.38972 type:complete len:143 (+) Transcript_26225:465-893(+)